MKFLRKHLPLIIRLVGIAIVFCVLFNWWKTEDINLGILAAIIYLQWNDSVLHDKLKDYFRNVDRQVEELRRSVSALKYKNDN